MRYVADYNAGNIGRKRASVCVIAVLITVLAMLLLMGGAYGSKLLIMMLAFTLLIPAVIFGILIHDYTLKLRNISPFFIVFLILVTLISVTGCVSEPSGIAKNETVNTPVSTDIPTTISTPVATNITPSTGQQGVVPPAPYQLYIKAGQIYQFTYGGIFHERRNFTVNYTSAYPTQIVKITFNGYEKTVQKEQTDKPNAIYWSEGGFGFTLKPVLWEIRDGQRGPSYEVTWNTTELYFEVRESK